MVVRWRKMAVRWGGWKKRAVRWGGEDGGEVGI